MSDKLSSPFERHTHTDARCRSKEIRTFADLFCGIGGFHFAASSLGLECVYACDIDADVRAAYQANFGILPDSDISTVQADDIPSFDLLCAGFPCQPFSIIGDRKGLADPRGTMFFEIARIADAKRPAAIVLENVRQLLTIDKGHVIKRICSDLEAMGYHIDFRVLNALDLGLPQKRERVIIAATQKQFGLFPWPSRKIPMKSLDKILEQNPDKKHYVSERIRRSRHAAHQSPFDVSIWHENKGGNVSSHPYSCALRAGASYNYLLVNGERRLTPREMLRLQGFPERFKIIGTDSAIRKQAGNAVPVPLAKAAIKGILEVYETEIEGQREAA